MMKDYVEIVGPCSKWIEGKGWVTKIPVELLKEAGFVKKKQAIRVSNGYPPVSAKDQIEAIEKYNLMGNRRRP